MSAALATAILRRTINATGLIYFLYQALELAAIPALALYLLYRGFRDRRYFAGVAERLGFLPGSLETTGAGSIWFHAVSVGEIFSSVELIRRVRTERPHAKIYVSTTTLTGRAAADEKLRGLADGIFFAPFDYRSVVRRVLRRLRPALVVVLETEIWPNLYRESKRAGAALMIVNGRISDRAMPRYRRWRWFFQHALACADTILAQSEEDRRRFMVAGAAADRVRVAGNLKYDFTPPSTGIAPEIEEFLDRLRPQKIWIAASTMTPGSSGDIDEDDAVLNALPRRGGDVLTILAPRKPERFDIVAGKLERAKIPFVRRSRGLAGASLNLPGVLLLDSIGELAALFARADAVFMGGTLASRGGHNILEPAYFGKAVIVGPHMENFAAIAEEFQNAGALVRISSPDELGAAVARLLDDPGETGTRARELAMSKRGVAARIAEEILRAYAAGVPDPPRTFPARVVLTPLSWAWRAGHRVNSARTQASLETPVISIGGLTMGGAGKSPMAAHLAARLFEMGRNPAILTRGYRRRSGEDVLVVPRGGKAPIEATGDEAQILIRRGVAHVGIGADRFAAGRRMERELAPDIFLLDDGFQHQRLGRKHDIVLIDALDPLGGGVFPLGRLREPPESLARADTIIVTRVELCQNISGIERWIAQYNTDAPVFRSRVVPLEWVDAETGEAAELPPVRVAAFCGLGSPRAFWRTLEELGIETMCHRAFPDHHRYRPEEMKALAASADILVTTEKDMMNLCAGALEIIAPRKLFWLRIGIEIEREEELLRRIL